MLSPLDTARLRLAKAISAVAAYFGVSDEKHLDHDQSTHAGGGVGGGKTSSVIGRDSAGREKKISELKKIASSWPRTHPHGGESPREVALRALEEPIVIELSTSDGETVGLAGLEESRYRSPSGSSIGVPSLLLADLATRTSGHGKDLMRQVAKYASESGVGIHLISNQDAFYQAIGMTREAGSPFYHWTPDDVKKFLEQGKSLQSKMTRKDAAEEVDAYASLLDDFIRQAWRGDMSRVDFARAHRELIREYARVVYIQGLEDCGVPEEEMDDSDDATIEDWTRGQLDHVSDFAAAVLAARGDETAQSAIEGRAELWVEALRGLATRACMSADKNKMGTWKFDPRKEHCVAHDGRVSCAWLNEKRHRLSWFLDNDYIPQEPGSETLGCGGWNCGCKIVDDRGRQLLP